MKLFLRGYLNVFLWAVFLREGKGRMDLVVFIFNWLKFCFKVIYDLVLIGKF